MNKTKKFVRSSLIFCLCRIVFPLVSGFFYIVPKSFFAAFSAPSAYVLSWIFTALPTKARKRTYKNLENTNFSSAIDKKDFFMKMMQLRVLHYLETIYEHARPGSCNVVNMDAFSQFMHKNVDRDKGMLVVTAHLGNWELLGKLVTAATPNRKCLMLAKKNKYHEVTRLIARMRVDMGMGILFVSEKSGLKQIMKNLHADTLIGFVADQKSQGRAGPRATFFGLETDFVSGPQRLSKKFNLPLLFCYAIRTCSLQYKIEFAKLEPSAGEDLQGYTQSMAGEFEKTISQHPEHWTWDYKKWIYS